MKKIFLVSLICIGAILVFILCLFEPHNSLDNSYMSYSFEPENCEITFAAKNDYAFTLAKSEYGTISLPNLSENTEPVQKIVISLKNLAVHKGDFIYFYIVSNDHDADSPDLQIVIYEILFQSESELYIARCKDHVGGIYERLDIYNPETGELISSR